MVREYDRQAFLALLRAGIWADDVSAESVKPGFADSVDWNEVYHLSETQSVIGIVFLGLGYSTVKPPQELLLQWIGKVQVIEQQNLATNTFIEKLVKEISDAGIDTLLVKGQGVAQCYEKPLWRSCGDVDLFFSDANYIRAKELLIPKATRLEPEEKYEKHLGMTIDGISVELHGSLRTGISRRIDKTIDEVQNDAFFAGNVRSWMNGGIKVPLPSVDCDVFFVFTHILKHFFKEGIGLRQLCDWCRLLWVCRDEVDHSLLRRRIKAAGIMTEWKSFAALAVDYLGMPIEAMPLYSASNRWQKNADKILGVILETGGFGHNRDVSYYSKHTRFVCKTISLWRYTKDSIRHFFVFPLDSIKAWFHILFRGLQAL